MSDTSASGTLTSDASIPGTLTPSQMASHTGLSLDTLRYYERVGLMPAVERLPNGHRRYHDSDVEWMGIVTCLRDTGMPIRHIQRYAALAAEGEHTMRERQELLERHRVEVIAQMDELRRNLDHLDGKIAWYAESSGAGS